MLREYHRYGNDLVDSDYGVTIDRAAQRLLRHRRARRRRYHGTGIGTSERLGHAGKERRGEPLADRFFKIG
jgi:hypothetical protein